jgi:threonine dehydrogenase-like Zn-dependent dehydrogenase
MPEEFLVTAPKRIEFREYAELPLEPDEVRVKALVSGIKTGTEMALYSGDTPFLNSQFDPKLRLFRPAEGNGLYPCNLGSWLVGTVVEIGLRVEKFKVGDPVHGGMAHRPTNVCKEADLYPLAAGMKLETALFTDPAIFALQAVHDAQIKVGDEVAVFGLGALGLLAVQMARMNGAEHVFAVDVIHTRLELARRFGADITLDASRCDAGLEIKEQTAGRGVDVAIEISGAYAALQAAIRGVHPGGRLVTASYFKGYGDQLQLGAEWHHNRLTLISSMPVWGMPHRNYPMWDLKRIERTALDLLESGRLATGPMVGARFPYTQAAEAYRFIDEKPEAAVKVLLDYAQEK